MNRAKISKEWLQRLRVNLINRNLCLTKELSSWLTRLKRPKVRGNKLLMIWTTSRKSRTSALRNRLMHWNFSWENLSQRFLNLLSLRQSFHRKWKILNVVWLKKQIELIRRRNILWDSWLRKSLLSMTCRRNMTLFQELNLMTFQRWRSRTKS